jgi:hypothetical protein
LPIHSPLRRLLELARKREIANLALDKGALAVTIVMGGVVVLLLAGTDILNWYWLGLLALVSLAAGVYLLRKSLSSRYILAQHIDRKLELKDAISTAYYFAEHPEPAKVALCESQFREAETVAAQVDVKLALPFTRSRYLAPAAALAAIAFGLFAVRYLVTGNLDLKASLVQAVYDNFFGSKNTEARNQLPPRAKFDPQMGNPNQDAQLEADRQPEDLLDSQDASEPSNSGDDNSKTAAENGSKKQGDSSGGDKGKEDPSGKGNEAQDQKDQQSSDGKNGDAKQGGKQGGKPSGSQKNESLLDKMKDALSNLMDKVKQEASEGSKGDESSPQNNPSDQKQDQGDKGQKSKDEQSQAAANGDQSQQAEGKQSSEAGNDKKASDKSASQDSKNGIGSQDGEKAIKEAEQLKAEGKISEILGKRSAAVSGEVMVEVGSSKQQLKTPWAQSQANHSNAGGEIHRDEIPLTEQQFIERYFEEVHKSASPAPADPSQEKKSGDG